MSRLTTFLFLLAAPAFCALNYIELSDRTDVLNGKSFGKAGPYERLVGKAYFLVDPKLPANASIADIDKAPVNEKGLVEFSADLYVLKPRDSRAGNGNVLFEVSNRGGRSMVGTFARSDAANGPDAGDGFFMEQGYTLAWIGWQFDVAPGKTLLHLYAPVATNHGQPIMGKVRAEFTPDARTDTMTLGDRTHQPYEILNPDDPKLQLTMRESAAGARKVVPRADWVVREGKIRMEKGFAPGHIYELVFESRNPPLAGLGPAAIRDFLSFLKYNGVARDSVLGDQYNIIKRVYGFGSSQSGRFLRTFVSDGFNADEKGRKVFDGVMANIAGGGRGSFNERFAQPSRDGNPFANTMYPVAVYPFTDLPAEDPVTHRNEGLLDRAVKSNTVPKIFYTNSSCEYWGRNAALATITPDGKADQPIPATSRVYFFAGSQHGPAAFPPGAGHAQNKGNPNDYKWALRALLIAMDRWVREGKEPPASVYPKLADLVSPGQLAFPKIPGVKTPLHPSDAYRMDFSVLPPKLGAQFPTLVPQVDADGIDRGGIRTPETAVPLASYTGWNLRSPAIGAPDQLASLQGSWIPFPRTKVQREKTGDSRLSIEERYPSKQDYLDRVRKAAQDMVAAGFLLDRDVDKQMARASAEWDYLQK